MLNAEERERFRELFGPILRPVIKKFWKEMERLISIWVKGFMEKEFNDELRCVIYAHMINKSGRKGNETIAL